MAYFPNGTAGMCFEAQCSRCRYGEKPCPIALVQMKNNYDAVGNNTATRILEALVDDDGTCAMFQMFAKEMAAPGLLIAEDGAPLFDPSVGPPAPVTA